MKIRDLQLLVRVADTGSMTQAASQLSLTPAAVSAAVQRVERDLGLRIFERTTRSLRPTQEGEVLIEGCRETVQRWRRALDEARGDEATLEGSVHLAAPADTTHLVLAEAVASFSEDHPGVRVVVHATDVLQNVLQDALDLSIRYGELRDSALVARRLARVPRMLVASPDYLLAHGTPASVADLSEHRLLTLQLGNTPEPSWDLRDPSGGSHQVPLESALCGDGLVVRRWAVAGHGIAFKSLFDVLEDLEAGRLVRVLPDHDGGSGPIHLVFPSRRFVPLRIRALADRIAAVFERRQQRCEAWVRTIPPAPGAR